MQALKALKDNYALYMNNFRQDVFRKTAQMQPVLVRRPESFRLSEKEKRCCDMATD